MWGEARRLGWACAWFVEHLSFHAIPLAHVPSQPPRLFQTLQVDTIKRWPLLAALKEVTRLRLGDAFAGLSQAQLEHEVAATAQHHFHQYVFAPVPQALAYSAAGVSTASAQPALAFSYRPPFNTQLGCKVLDFGSLRMFEW